MSYRIEKGTNDIVIDGWEVGISNSPYQSTLNTALVAQGVSDARNIDLITVPGEASVAMATQNYLHSRSINKCSLYGRCGRFYLLDTRSHAIRS